MSKFRFQGRLQPPTGKSDFYTPPPFRVCDECKGTGYHDQIDVYPIPCPVCDMAGRIPIYYTIPQWEELTGRKVTDYTMIWGWDGVEWNYYARCEEHYDIEVVATEAGIPSWRPING